MQTEETDTIDYSAIFAELDSLYTPLSEAVVELERRRRDIALCARVDEYFSTYSELPELVVSPRIVMARALCTPNLELIYVLDILKHQPYRGIFYEFTKDKLVTNNITKANLQRMRFLEDGIFTRRNITGSYTVVDRDKSEGELISEIQTNSGESLVNFHHRISKAYLGEDMIETVDFSEWFRGSYFFNKEFRYLRYLGSFLTGGILLENFLLTKNEQDFTTKKVIPAFRKLEKDLGIKPLVVPIVPREVGDARTWNCYPEKIRDLI